MVGFGVDYACTHIIIPASVNLLPIQTDFVTERDIGSPIGYRRLHQQQRSKTSLAIFYIARENKVSNC